MYDCLGQVLLHHGPGDAELAGNLLERVAIAPVQNKAGVRSGRDLPERLVQLLKALTGLQVCCGIFLDVRLDFRKHVGHLYRFRRCGLV